MEQLTNIAIRKQMHILEVEVLISKGEAALAI